MFNSICKHFCLTIAVGAGVLLGADDDGFGAVEFVDAVDHIVKSLQLFDLIGSDIEEVLLDGAVRRDSHHNDTSPLILNTLNEDPIQHLTSCLDDGDGRTGGGDESQLVVLPVLQQVFAEGITADKDAYYRGDGVLFPQLLGTSAGIVCNVSPKRFLVGDHPIKRAAGADGFLLSQLLIRHDILSVEFLPSTDNVNIIEGLTYPVLMMFREVKSRSAAQGMESLSVPSADAPDIFHWQPFQGGDAVFVVVDDATMTIYFELLANLEAILARVLLGASPMLTGIPTERLMRLYRCSPHFCRLMCSMPSK